MINKNKLHTQLNRAFDFMKSHKQLIYGVLIGVLVATPSYLYLNELSLNQKSQPATEKTLELLEASDSTIKEAATAPAIESAPQNQQVTTSQKTNQSSSSAPSKASVESTNAINQTPVPQSSCNETLKATYRSVYDSSVNSENAYHTSEINRIDGYYAAHGAYDSTFRAGAIEAENTRHETKLNQLLSDYQNKIAEIGCM